MPSSAATIQFQFDDGTEFDGAQLATMTRSASGESATITVIDILTPEFGDPADTSQPSSPTNPLLPTGVILSAAAMDDVSMNLGGDGIGINHPFGETAWEDAGFFPGGNERENFNTGDVLILEFDRDVTFTEIDFGSLGDDEAFQVEIEGVATIFTFEDTNPNDIFADPFGSQVIPAGADITFSVVGDITLVSIQLVDFTIETVVPEPSAICLLFGFASTAAFRRRAS